LVEGTAVKGERSESPATPKAPWTAETKTKQSNSGEAENPTTQKGTVMERRITVVEVVAVLGTTARSSPRLIAERRIRFVRIGRLVRVPQPAIG
jgi:excisionase family DNA binding protein